MPKKVRRLALTSALSEKVGSGNMTILDSLDLDVPKTKTIKGILDALEAGRSTLLVIPEENQNLELSARNLPGVTVMRSEGVNVYDLLDHENFVILESAVRKLEERLS